MAASPLRASGSSGHPTSRERSKALVGRPRRAPLRAVAREPELAKRQPGGPETARAKVAAIQRARILAAAVRAVDELGYAETSVAGIVARSQVSRRTFYELFANRDECLAGVLNDTIARAERELERANVTRLRWRKRLRVGLWTILSFLDREPELARVCLVRAPGGSEELRSQQQRVLSRLAAVVDLGRHEGVRGGECTPLTAEGLVGAAYMIIHARLASRERAPLVDLLGELMGMIVLPYLGPAAARREQARPAPDEIAVATDGKPARVSLALTEQDPLQGVRMRLTYRTARVLEAAGEHPGASNRRMADLAGIGDAGQVSKLLRRLQHLGLLENGAVGHSQGEPNQWKLTAKGELVADEIRSHASLGVAAP